MISQLVHLSAAFYKALCFVQDRGSGPARPPRSCRSAVPATACAFAAGTINVASGPGDARPRAMPRAMPRLSKKYFKDGTWWNWQVSRNFCIETCQETRHFARSLASILFALFHATKNTDHGPCTKLSLAAGTKQFADSFHPSRAAFCNRLGSALVTWWHGGSSVDIPNSLWVTNVF